jgi:hypothetical protein
LNGGGLNNSRGFDRWTGRIQTRLLGLKYLGTAGANQAGPKDDQTQSETDEGEGEGLGSGYGHWGGRRGKGRDERGEVGVAGIVGRVGIEWRRLMSVAGTRN